MAKINVNREVTDVFYRYKMPAIIAKVEGKGNGVRTVLPNLIEIAKSLERPTIYLLKFFGHEVGTQTQVEKLSPQEVRFIINGIHTAAKLQDILHHFVKRFVLCCECSNPETELFVKNARITMNCKACGYIGQISAMSKVEGKMESYIIKNPIDDTPGTKKTGKKGKKGHDKKQRRSPDDDRVSPTENGYAEAIGTNDSDASEEWSENVTSMTEKMKNTTVTAVTALIQDDTVSQLSQQERSESFLQLANDIYKKKGIAGLRSSLDQLKNEASKLELENRSASILAEILLTKSIIEDIPRAAPILIYFTFENTKAQRHLLGVMEALVSQHRSFLLKRVPHILKCLYDNDLVEEECILDWDDNPSKKYVPDAELQTEMRKSATIFTKWLREAENDSGSDHEAVDDDIKVEFTENTNAGIETNSQLKVETAATNHEATPVAVEDNDLDDFIDNI